MKKSGKKVFIFVLLFIPLTILSSDKKMQLRKSQTEINYFKNSIGQEFVYIKPGKFLMGSYENESGRSYDEKLHRVIISKGFYMQTTEVTRKQWLAVMKTKPWLKDRIKQKGWNYPVTYVSWLDAKAFIKKLNQKENTYKYRLPTEAEWEYSCVQELQQNIVLGMMKRIYTNTHGLKKMFMTLENFIARKLS